MNIDQRHKEFLKVKHDRYEVEMFQKMYSFLSVAQKFDVKAFILLKGYTPRKALEKIGVTCLANPFHD